MVFILSFDCGVTNLAWCMYHTTTDTITDWQVRSLPKNIKRDNLCEHLIEKLDAWGFDTLSDIKNMLQHNDEMHVIIENQPFRNSACKIIEVTLQSYFIMRTKSNDDYPVKVKEVCTISPCVKLRGHAEGEIKLKKGSKGYKGRKDGGVQVINTLPCVHKSPEWQSYFDHLKKKDDVADALLQALGYASSLKGADPQKDTRRNFQKIIARKPTKPTQLSDANCKWYLKQILYPRTKKMRRGAFQRLESEIEQHNNKSLKVAIGKLEERHGSMDNTLRYLGLIR